MSENNEIESGLDQDSESAEGTELGHFEKAAGIFYEPAQTFSKAARFKPAVTDWLIPVIIFIVIALLSNVVLMNRPNIKNQVKEEQEKKLTELVEQGKISQEQADTQMEQADKMFSGVYLIIQAVSTIFIVLISFFIVTLIYYLLSKFALKGEGNFASAMTANGLSTYISSLQMIFILIISLISDKLYKGLSIADLFGMNKGSAVGYFLGKTDPLTIWAMVILSIGLAKMFHSDDSKKYYIGVFGVWIAWVLIVFGISRVFPSLSFLAGA